MKSHHFRVLPHRLDPKVATFASLMSLVALAVCTEESRGVCAPATGEGPGDRSMESAGFGGAGGGVAGSGGTGGPGGRAGSPGAEECAGPMPTSTCLGLVHACLTDVPDCALCTNGTWTCPTFPPPTPPVDCFASPDAGPTGGICVRGTAQVSTTCLVTLRWLCPDGLIHASSCVCFVDVAGDLCAAGGRGGAGGAAGRGGGAGGASGASEGTGCSVGVPAPDDAPLGLVHVLAIAAFAAGRRRLRALARKGRAA